MDRWLSHMDILLEKLGILRGEVIAWQKKKKIALTKELQDIIGELDTIGSQLASHDLPEATHCCIKELEQKRKYIMSIVESNWRLKSRAIWIWEGECNTKLFHRFFNHRRKINTT